MNQQEYDNLYQSILFQREIENMEINEKFNHQVSENSYYLKIIISKKIAKVNDNEIEIETALRENLKDNSSAYSEEELSEIRINMIQSMLTERDESYIRSIRYIENEEDQSTILAINRYIASQTFEEDAIENIDYFMDNLIDYGKEI